MMNYEIFIASGTNIKYMETTYNNKYNNWCKASKLIAPALTTIWSQIFKMGPWKKKNSNAKLLIVLLVFYYFHNYHFDQ